MPRSSTRTSASSGSGIGSGEEREAVSWMGVVVRGPSAESGLDARLSMCARSRLSCYVVTTWWQ